MSEEYNDLVSTGYSPPERTAPEDELFHSIYISGSSRKNHIGIVEKSGFIQIRGFQYNLEKVFFIIMHVKSMLVKREKQNQKEKITCFSYQNSAPAIGSSGRICPKNSEERNNTPACSGCKGEIVISGILCEESGKPIKNEESGKPIFTFIRGKGAKSPNIYSYLERISKLETDPLFPEDPTLEKLVVRNKRYVTQVTISTQKTGFGDKLVFEFDFGSKLSDVTVKEVMKIQKKTIPQFNEKFDWSKNINKANPSDDEQTLEENELKTETAKTDKVENKVETDFLKDFDF